MRILRFPLPDLLPCKVCGGTARRFGAVDRNQSCEAARGDPFAGLGPANELVPYHRCTNCGLVFTVAFDDFTPADWTGSIYNDDYIKVDPDFIESRPTNIAAFINGQFANAKSARLLDFGGGNGSTAQRLRDNGFVNCVCYDPFVPQFAKRPEGKFDLILAFEVAEHSPRPLETFADMASFAADESLIVFTTLLQPQDIEQLGLSNWWYAAPRNGHVTLYTRHALAHVAQSINARVASTGDLIHLMFKRLPAFAKSMVR